MNAARRIVEIDSTDLEGWQVLAYTHQAYGWQYGAGLADIRAAAERGVALDPHHIPSLVGRAWLAAVGADSDDAAAQTQRLSRADTTQPLVAGLLGGLRAATGPATTFDSMVPRLATRPLPEWITTLRILRASRPERAERLLTAVRAAAPAGPAATSAFGALLQIWVAEGRIRAVDSLVQAGTLDGTLWLRRAVEFHLVAADLAGVGDPEVARRVADSLAAWFLPDSAAAQLQNRPVWRAAWAIGAHNATFGDTMLTRRWRAALGRLPRGEGSLSQDWVGALQADFDARLAARRGNLGTALQYAQRAYRLWTIHTDNISEGEPEPAMRLHLALLHLARGQADSAEAYLRSLVPPTSWMGFLTARASLELGQIAERRRDYDQAAQYYARALDLWDRGGEEVADWRARARDGVARMTRRTG
jgi:tetratricopeptide (TPR) repeat protein